MIDSILDYLVSHTWVGEVFLIVLGTAAAHLLARIAFNRLERRFEVTHNLYDDALLGAARRPLSYAIWVLGVAWAADVAGGTAEAVKLTHPRDDRHATWTSRAAAPRLGTAWPRAQIRPHRGQLRLQRVAPRAPRP